MARTINVDSFSFRNLTLGTDSIKVKYFRTKADQEGKKCQHKNIYANPFNPKVCFFTGMGIYCAVHASILGTRNTFFLKVNTLAGTASSSFCRFLSALCKEYKVVVAEHVRMEHCNAHGIRKGSGTHSTSCTTCPPLLVAVALRGDWSMGKIFDTYFTFGDFGDQYLGKSCPILLCNICQNLTHDRIIFCLGRILAGLNPSKPCFATLPPHFKEGMSNKFVYEAMRCMYGPILDYHSNSHGILLLCLASVVYHSDFLEGVASKKPGHPLNLLPILHNDSLLAELKKLVVLKSDAITPTGVPPHVEQIKFLEKIYMVVQKSVELLNTQIDSIKEAVTAAIDANDLRSGTLNLNTLQVCPLIFCCVQNYLT